MSIGSNGSRGLRRGIRSQDVG